jgi:hypothetical protein
LAEDPGSNCDRSLTRPEQWFVMESIGAPGEIRTPGLLVRSQALYPTELRARIEQIEGKYMAEREGFEPSMGF